MGAHLQAVHLVIVSFFSNQIRGCDVGEPNEQGMPAVWSLQLQR